MSRRPYDRNIPSDGLTIDTDHGPVDTVALDRVRRGIRTTITRAESVVITAELTYNDEAERLLAAGLGITQLSVRQRVARVRRQQQATRPGDAMPAP